VVHYRLATGADEKKAARNRVMNSAMIDMLMLRIVSIDGVGETKPTDIGSQRVVMGIRSYLEDLEWSELVHLLNSLDAHDCGVDVEIEVQCPVCGGGQEVVLPFERGFFLPEEKKPNRSSASSI
jgi:hypothetical protein